MTVRIEWQSFPIQLKEEPSKCKKEKPLPDNNMLPITKQEIFLATIKK